MKYKPYDEYKKSGVNLLEQIPKNWQKYSFKELFTKKEITNLTNEGLLSVYLDRGVIPYSEGGGLVHKPSESLEKYQLVDINDFVMNNQQAWRGSVGISNYRGIVSPAYLVFSTDKEKADPSYLKYLLKDNISVSQFSLSSLSVGTIQRQVKWHLLRNISLFLPSLDDQLKISKFLDKEILKIDNLISKQEKLIKLLDEQRKSIISHAVTKGLNPSAPLKHIDHKWIGQIPEHWDMYRLRFISKIYAGGTPDRKCKEYWENGTIPWINSGAVNQVNIVTPSEYITEMGYRNSSANYIPKNSLVMALAGQGKTKGMVAYTSIETTCNQSMAAIVPKDYDYKFLFYWLSANYQNIRNMTGGDNREGLNLVILSSIPCPKLPINEQREIALYLDKETLKIDNLILKQNQLIEKLKEYRSSIISHAVTGKIDVREAL